MLADTSRYSEAKSQPRKLLTHINGLNRPASCTLFFPPHGCLQPEHRPGYRDKATLYHPIDKCTISKTSLRDIWKTQRQQRRAQISLPLQRTKRKRKRKPRKVIQSIRGLSTVKGAASNWSRLPADRQFRFGPLLYSIRWKYILYVKHWYFHRSLSYNQHLIPHYFLSFRQCLRWNYKLPYQ